MPTSDLLSDVHGFQTWATVGLLLTLALWETIAPYMAFRNRRAGPRWRHAGRNVALSIINLTIQRFVFIGLWVGVTRWVTANNFGIANLTELPLWGHALVVLFLFDIWTYWWHRINHEVPFFWRFHQVHHSDTEMDVTTAYRFHFGEMSLSSLFRIPIIALIGAQLWEVALYDLILFASVQFHHSNIGISDRFDRIWRLFLVSPLMHKVHHSMNPRELNTNYTSLLTVWDRLFGSYYMTDKPEEIEFGVGGYRDPEQQRLSSLLKCPINASKVPR